MPPALPDNRQFKPNDKIGFKPLSRMPVSRQSFRQACSRFATGVAVATLLDSTGQPHGLTVNSFTSVSATPPLVLICIDGHSSLLPHFRAARHYGLSFLADSQQDISNRFAVFPEGRFQGLNWASGAETGVPLLSGVVGWMECSIRQAIEAGDHVIFLAEVVACQASDGHPLLYFASGYKRMA
jgi:flavin reductase (DIM6/NTAB) family NADH-FMN oxidoreductase RutF